MSHHMPYNPRVEPVEVFLENIPGFNSIKFHRVSQPAFLDHALDAQAVVTNVFTLTEMEEAIRKAEGRVYIYLCTQDWEQERDSKYCLRWKVVEEKLAPLFTDLDISTTTELDPANFIPTWPGKFKLQIETLHDLERAWGRDEVVRQLGEYIVQGVEVRNYDGKPESAARGESQ